MMAKVTVETQKIIRLNMTEYEARVLAKVLANVGGHPTTTHRGAVGVMADALDKAGVVPVNSHVMGSMHFLDKQTD
jgi:hypothetical protein